MISQNPLFAAYLIGECISQVIAWESDEREKIEREKKKKEEMNSEGLKEDKVGLEGESVEKTSPARLSSEPHPLSHRTPWIVAIFTGNDLSPKFAFAKVLLSAMRVLYVVGVYEEVRMRKNLSQKLNKEVESDGSAPGFQSPLFSPVLILLQTFLHYLLNILPCQQSRCHSFLALFLLIRDFASYGSIPSLLLLSVDYPRRIVGLL
jgi:hypothetical protein